MSNLVLIAFLLAGFFIGYKDIIRLSPKVYNRLLMGVILLLLFIMGVILGIAPDLGSRLVKYGYTAFVITAASMIGGAIAVWLIVKLTKTAS